MPLRHSLCREVKISALWLDRPEPVEEWLLRPDDYQTAIDFCHGKRLQADRRNVNT